MSKKNEEWLKLVVLSVVTLLWSISVLVDLLSKDYSTPELIHGLMGLVVGYFVGDKIAKRYSK